MLVSAYWHGVHLGYYLSFMTIPLCTYVEDLLFAGKNEVRLKTPWVRFAWWLIRTKGFEYMSCGFLLLSFNSTLLYWSSIGYFLHTAMIALIPVAFILNAHWPCEQQKEKKL